MTSCEYDLAKTDRHAVLTKLSAETKGMDDYDSYEAKKRARAGAEQMYDEHYIQRHKAEEYNPDQYQQPNFNY